MGKVTGLTALGAAPASTDVCYIVDDPGGTPVSKKVTVDNLLGASAGLLSATAGTVTASKAVIVDANKDAGDFRFLLFGDSGGIKLGADDDCTILHDGTTGVDVSVADNDAGALVVKQGSDAYITVATTNNSEKLTLASVQDIEVNCGQTATDSVKLQAYDVGATAYETMITLASHATTPTMTLAASGGITISNGVTVANTMDIVAATSGGSDLGSTSGEWGNIYVGDSKGVQFGADQDATIVHDGTGGLNVTLANNVANAIDIKEATNSYIKIVTTTGSEKMTLASEQDIEINSGQTATDSVKIQAYDVGATAYEALITASSHATTPTMAINATGGVTMGGATGGVTLASPFNYAAGGGAADVQTVTLSPAPAAYVTGMIVCWRPTADNTGACTVNVNGLGAKSIKTQSGADPAAGDLDGTTGIAMAMYDGTNFVLINPATTTD